LLDDVVDSIRHVDLPDTISRLRYYLNDRFTSSNIGSGELVRPVSGTCRAGGSRTGIAARCATSLGAPTRRPSVMTGSKKRWFSLAAPATTVARLTARVRRWARTISPELPPMRGPTDTGTSVMKPFVVAATSTGAVAIDRSHYQLGWRKDNDSDFSWDACPTCGEGHPPPIDPCINEIGAH
jgi:hypothetical protein